MEKLQKKNYGFTIVELSISLIIIGLIIGSVLIGKTLIAEAQIRGQVSQITTLFASINTFNDKFYAIPGDFRDANTLLPGAPANGDGDGLIMDTGSGSGNQPPINFAFEIQSMFNHLSAAGMADQTYSGTGTPNPGTNLAKIKTGPNGIIAYANNGYNYLHLGVAPGAATVMTTKDVFTPTDTFALDKKMDDGLPNTGIVRAMYFTSIEPAGSGGQTTNAGSNGANCVSGTSGTATYVAGTNTGLLTCQMRVEFPVK